MCVLAARHLDCAETNQQIGVGEAVRTGDRDCAVRGCGDHELVGGEDRRGHDVALSCQLGHHLLVRHGDDVGGNTLVDLEPQCATPCDIHVDVDAWIRLLERDLHLLEGVRQ